MACDDGHFARPHHHVRTEEGRWKPCSGRWWCTRCKTWLTGPQCDLPGAPQLPAAWLK
jgi:hypothetical protein